MKSLHRTILQTRRLSPSNREISPFWLISLRLSVSAINLSVFEIFQTLPAETPHLTQIFRNTPTCFVFFDCLFKKFHSIFYLFFKF